MLGWVECELRLMRLGYVVLSVSYIRLMRLSQVVVLCCVECELA